MNWGLLAASLFIGAPTLWTITDTNITEEDMIDAGVSVENSAKGIGGTEKGGRGSSEGSEGDVKEAV
jgi:hypothetical protein